MQLTKHQSRFDVVKIGVFDSGVGGLSVARAIRKALPHHRVVLREDNQHLPYGTKLPAEILDFVIPILEDLVAQGCGVIVIACNTVTTTLISDLRQRIAVPLVAIEPMVKPAAAETRSGIIAVCATPTTLASGRYHWLKDTYAKGVTVLEPDCSDWALMIENNSVDDAKITGRINQVLDRGADVIVLGCTHYHWIEKRISELVEGRARVMQPESAIIRQLIRVMQELAKEG